VLSGEALTAGGLIVPEGMVADSIVAQVRPRRLGPHRGALLDTGHGWLEILIHEEGALPRFRIYPCKASGDPVPLPRATRVSVDTARLDGSMQKFALEARDGFWESVGEVPEPHEFVATISLGHSGHAHTYRLRFAEDQDRPEAATHGQGRTIVEEPENDGVEYQDAHERAHAQDIARRFANRAVTTPQIILFGITGGLMPCPAAFTVLLVCLQIKKVALGFTMVASFSFGLALTMVAVGVIAAWSVQKAHKRFRGFGEWMRKAPYISCVVLMLLAAVMGWQGVRGLSHPHVHHQETFVAP
jgi:nickel/cobalt exporter